MNTEKRDFDKEAATWDERPSRVKLAEDISRAITKQIVLTPEMDAMDFGCGTGLLTFRIQPHVRSITGVDSSRGMLDVFNSRIAQLKLNNVSSFHADLEKGDTLKGNYNLVLSSMTLHHIKEIKILFDEFYKIILPDGYLCIADLDPDDGRFHEDNTGVFHFGFGREALRLIFMEAGFDDVLDANAAEVVKPGVNGELRRFGVFLMTGRKKENL